MRRIGLIVFCCLSAYAEVRRIKIEWSETTPTVGTVHSSEIIVSAERSCIAAIKGVEWVSTEANNPRRYSADLHSAELANRPKVEKDIRACLSGGNQ